jgi:hypothetical protein
MPHKHVTLNKNHTHLPADTEVPLSTKSCCGAAAVLSICWLQFELSLLLLTQSVNPSNFGNCSRVSLFQSAVKPTSAATSATKHEKIHLLVQLREFQ